VASGLCVVLMLGGSVAGLAGTASAAACVPPELSASGDIDGDGAADVAVGMPWYADGSGAVDVRLSNSPSVLLRASDLGAGTGEGDGFGAAVVVADLDRDYCADLVIGAPAEGQSDASDGAGDNEGQVHLVFGRPGGLDLSSSIVLRHDSSDLDFFGSSLAVVSREDEAREVSVWDIYVGAPRATVNGHKLAGEVFRYSLEPSPAERVPLCARSKARTRQVSPGPPRTATASGPCWRRSVQAECWSVLRTRTSGRRAMPERSGSSG
jgi:hypothetical protein